MMMMMIMMMMMLFCLYFFDSDACCEVVVLVGWCEGGCEKLWSVTGGCTVLEKTEMEN